jgi:hypothetical protein
MQQLIECGENRKGQIGKEDNVEGLKGEGEIFGLEIIRF